ncbi:MAG: T9SS type A sorting domain-containing protein [Ignavibacteriales bacterium]|nr:MAG: T9SS type A sorting domain-containing protein [Ignavibacteriales bacterium]
MKKFFSGFFFVLMLIGLGNIRVFSQQCEVSVSNIIFESSNSLTFDVYVKNNGATSWTYSHGSMAWTYDPSFLNSGTPTFSIVPGYSSFPTGAQPPSALITSPNILRTSSNMPGSNGVVPPGQNLRLQRFRLQTSAASFSSNYFVPSWKTSVVPYTRVYGWDNGTGLPAEISTIDFILDQPLLVENFEFTGLLTANGWTAHSGGGTNALSTTTGLTYAGYPGTAVGNAVLVNNTGGEDVNRALADSVQENSVYFSFLLNVNEAAISKTGDYFFHLGNRVTSTSFTLFSARLFARVVSDQVNIGISNTSTATYGTNNFAKNQTYLIVGKYSINTGGNDSVAVWVISSGIPATEIAAGAPELLNIGTAGQDVIDAVGLRQGNASTSPSLIADGIRVAKSWEDLFSAPTGPTLSALPSALSNFTYFIGGGPSPSQSYVLSGSELTPASGDIVVTGSTNYEVSTDNTNFSSSVNVGYTGAALNATVYVRLKAGLPGGFYNAENISNAGGGATTINVSCNGAVVKPEPSNHVTAFNGVAGNPAYHFINLSWVDAVGSTTPDGYLVKASDVDFASIIDPVDGTPENNSFFVQNITAGVQAYSFGGNSVTPYYFKIYPYTNSGTVINYKTDGTVPQFTLTTASTPALPITDNFEYVPGTALTANGWVAHSAGGTNVILVNDSSLTYTGYINSATGNSITSTSSGEDVNRAFSSVTSNSVYASFMINVSAAQLNGDYIFHFAPENSTLLFFGKIFVKADASNNIAFGVAKNVNTSAVYTPFSYALNTTYLVVVKYTFNDVTTTDDEVKLWINPVLDGTEPAADITQTDTGTDALELGMFAFRQGNSSNASTQVIGGLRVANTWIPNSSQSTFQLSVNVTDGWNMVSAPGNHPVNQNVNTWWPNRNPLADVYKWSGSYSAVSLTTQGEGYWMLHNGANTYNTGDEWPAGGIEIVAHNPVVVSEGWNMIGAYEQSVPVASLTTTPSGLIVSNTIYGWNGAYFNPVNLEPGYGYWVLLSGSGVINIPTTIESVTVAKQVDKSNWGKIIVTDASGKNLTLYLVNDEVNLNHYLLPPSPPAGAFDVRFGSGRLAENLKEGSKSIELNGMKYPVTVRLENANIKLQDESGKIFNERMKTGGELVITNSAVTKLLVSADIIPDKFALEQNYPNPFNPATTVQFDVPQTSDVVIKIYDMLGQEVRTLFSGQVEGGTYKVQWDGLNNSGQQISSGSYIYRMTAGEFVQTKKMIMLK